MALEVPVDSGLQNVVAAATHLSSVDGLAGELVIAGFLLEEIAPNATFEEMVYLLWNDHLPNAEQLAAFNAELVANRALAPVTVDVLRAAAKQKVAPMDALRMGASTLSLGLKGDDMRAGAVRAVAAFPTIVAAYWRLQDGLEPVAPRDDLGHAANLLYMLKDEVPTEAQTRALNTYLNTVVDHGLNASTFTARVIISTDSDMISALTGAVGALKGPKHGGAPGPALDMVFEIGKPENAEPYLREKLGRGDVLMGFGHRVYKVRDPRADVLHVAAEKFFESGEGQDLYKLALYVEKVALRLLEEYKPGRNLQTNVEFYTALVLHGIGLPSDLFSSMFAVSRVAGWSAHCFEHAASGRIVRPQSVYTGEKDRTWVSIDER